MANKTALRRHLFTISSYLRADADFHLDGCLLEDYNDFIGVQASRHIFLCIFTTTF